MGRDYNEVLEEIRGLDRFQEEISLDPVREAAARLGNPQDGFRSIHVAGTNGKGSTATILARVLEKEELKTGLFTSPPLMDFRERMEVDGERISREEVVSIYNSISSLDVELSFFETVTLIAFEYFSRQGADFAVIETGMGGESDATNILRPELSIVTNVSREHTGWLGETEEEIAQSLAGVVKDRTPVVSGAGGRAGAVIEEAAEEKEAEFHEVSEPPEISDNESFNLRLDIEGEAVDTGLVGGYQAENVATVL
ncbi:MAG: folylpolyglutamate synthase/dihydrofolate synthase family protein, partial [Candidatus Nanohaloarchaea archaeon]